jgi:hypothetical protein
MDDGNWVCEKAGGNGPGLRCHHPMGMDVSETIAIIALVQAIVVGVSEVLTHQEEEEGRDLYTESTSTCLRMN